MLDRSGTIALARHRDRRQHFAADQKGDPVQWPLLSIASGAIFSRGFATARKSRPREVVSFVQR
jgi:hypothetical protein